MRHLFTPEGEAALAAVMAARPLLAFDFDGTLAPIVARPEDARRRARDRGPARAPRAAPAARDRQRPPRRRHPRAPRLRAALRDRQPRRRGSVGRSASQRRRSTACETRLARAQPRARGARRRRRGQGLLDRAALPARDRPRGGVPARQPSRREPAGRPARVRRQDGDEHRARGGAEQGRRGLEPGRAIGCAQRGLRRRRPQRRAGVRGRRAGMADDPDRPRRDAVAGPLLPRESRTRSRCCLDRMLILLGDPAAPLGAVSIP